MKKLLLLPLFLFANEIDEYRNFYLNQQKQFNEYKINLNKEFKLYKQTLMNEFEKYKKNIAKNWDDIEYTTSKKYVLYDKRFKKRAIVDYEKNYIKVDVLLDKNATNNKVKTELAKTLTKILIQDTQKAYKEDKVIYNIEKKLHIKQTKIPPKPIIYDVVFQKKPSIKEAIDYSVKKVQTYKVKPSKLPNFNKYEVIVKLPPRSFLLKAKTYKEYVEYYSNKNKLPKELVYAVIHTESSFNPMCRSYVPAFGLMQIVPKTAGLDTYYYLYKQKRLLSASYLYNPKNNILIGSTYLHIVYYNYFKNIKNPKSRLYCTIAAYNTGAGNVARSFGVRLRDLPKKVNNLSPDEVYNHLINNLPYDETKNYLKRVYKRYFVYKKAYEKGIL